MRREGERERGGNPGTRLVRVADGPAEGPGRSVRIRLDRPRGRWGRRFPAGAAMDLLSGRFRGVFVSAVQATFVTFLQKEKNFSCWE